MGDTIHERKRPRTTRETVSVSGVPYLSDRYIGNSVLGGQNEEQPRGAIQVGPFD